MVPDVLQVEDKSQTIKQSTINSGNIECLWQFIKSTWSHQNTIVHGSDTQPSDENISQVLCQQINSIYREYNDNPPSSSLITTIYSQADCIKHTYDHIPCWIWSVSKAKLVLAHHNCQLWDHSCSSSHNQYSTGRNFFLALSTPGITDTSMALYTTSIDDEPITDTFTTNTSTSNTYTLLTPAMALGVPITSPQLFSGGSVSGPFNAGMIL